MLEKWEAGREWLSGWRRWLVGGRGFQQQSGIDLRGQIVVITGSSRGLGFLLAREFAREGCKLVICARDEQELERARVDLANQGAEVLAVKCDVSDESQVERMIGEATLHYGQVDILVNNAGIIQVGPIHDMTIQNFQEALGIIFWGTLYPILAVLPQMRARKSGRIVNITSIGGKVSVPHLTPYSAGKFACVGLSEGLRAELARDGISVTTIVPGLMRTGSHVNALFKGHQSAEFTWFSLGASLPMISMDAERAARQIVSATKRREAERILSLPAQALALFHGVCPKTTSNILGLINRLILPPPAGAPKEITQGMEIQRKINSPALNFLTGLGLNAARRFHQYPGPLATIEHQVKSRT